MEFHQLRCFAAAVEEGGFKRATGRLALTQPALSYQIKQLEEELGVLLFHRRPTGVTPTETGRVLYEHARRLLEMAQRAERAVREAAGEVVGKFRIATVNSIGIYLLPEILKRMKEDYPESRPSVLYCSSQEVIDALLTDRVDVALAANPRPDPRLREEVITEEPMSLVCGINHRFAGRKRVDVTELEGMDFVSLSKDNPTGRLVGDYLARTGVTVQEVVTADSLETVRRMVEIGLGAAFVPGMVLGRNPVDGVGPLKGLSRIEINPMLTRRISLVTWRRLEVSRAVAAFIEELRTAVAAADNSGGATSRTGD